jgi:hypothetical protein
MTEIRTSRAELRQFGLLVGGVLLALGGWWRYRQMFATGSFVALSAGTALVACAAVAPASLRFVHRYWMALAEAMSFVMTRVILLLVFTLVVTPIGVVRRMFGADPLRRRGARSDSYWEQYPVRQHDRRHYEKMF